MCTCEKELRRECTSSNRQSQYSREKGNSDSCMCMPTAIFYNTYLYVHLQMYGKNMF